MSTALVPAPIASNHSNDDPETRAVRGARERPEARKLQEELRNTIADWQSNNRFEKLQEAGRIRSCYHAQRNGTGRFGKPRPGETNVFPWQDAPDVDSNLVDQICREQLDIHMLAWIMGQRSVRPRDVMNDEGHRKSEAWRHLLDFELDQTERQRGDALELFFNCLAEMNACVWLEDWRACWRKGRKHMSFVDMVQAVVGQMTMNEEEGGGGVGGGLEIQDQVMEQALGALHDPELRPLLVEWVRAVDPLCPVDEAKKVIAAWRKGEFVDVPYFAPVPKPGHASPRALIPGVHCLWPVLGERHQLPTLDVFEWLTGAEVRARSASENWDPEWTKELLNHPGMVVDWNVSAWGDYDGYALNGLDFSTRLDVRALENADLYQVAWHHDWGVDEMGLLSPFTYLYHGMFEGVGLSECDPHGTGRHHFVIVNDEVRSSYTADFRGIAHRLNSAQIMEKDLSDGITCQALLRAGPPMVDSMDGGSDGLRPFARLPMDPRTIGKGGDFRFLEVPTVSPEVVEWFKMNRQRVDELMMRGTTVDPDAKRARRQRLLYRACMFFREMELLLCQNAREDIRLNGALTLGSVKGVPVNQIIQIEDLEGELDVQHKCDVAAMDIELVGLKVDLLTKVLGFDKYGATDYNKLFRIVVGWLDPDISGGAITTFAQATDREKSETESLISKVVSGNLMMDELEKDAGNPELRMGLIDQWMSVPQNQQKMMRDPLTQEQLMKLREHYAFQVQQFSNAQTGRVRGTAPELKSLGEGTPGQGGGGSQELMAA